MTDSSPSYADEDENNKPKTKTFNVAIIGAGFAGLTLANYLKRHSPFVQFQLFDSKAEPIPIVGSIRLPNAKRVLKELKITQIKEGEEEQQQINHNCSNDYISREDFLNLLRRGVFIQYACRIVRVTKQRQPSEDSSRHLDNDKYKYYVSTDQGQDYGPFDLVVAADGIFGQTSLNHLGAVIGDARWYQDVWFWDFGRRRIREGGDIAITDGIELGRLLIAAAKEATTTPLQLFINYDSDSIQKFLVHRQRQHERRWFILKRVLLIPILLAILLYRAQFEKI